MVSLDRCKSAKYLFADFIFYFVFFLNFSLEEYFPKIIDSRGDIFRVQTRRVSQTIVFRYREIGGRLCMKHRKK
jgi:hypothetical protein